MNFIGMSPLITAYILVVAGVLGAVMGSFLNCMGWRLAHGESVLKGRSHCGNCGHVLSVPDLVPIFSYLFLRGKCRHCGKPIGKDCIITEILLAAAFVVCILRFDLSPEAIETMGVCCALMALSIVDLAIMEIPDRFHVFLIIWWAVFIPIRAWWDNIAALSIYGVDPTADGTCAWALMRASVLEQVKSGLIGAFVIAGAILIMTLIFEKVSGKEAMGGGDIKLYFSVTLYLGVMTGLFNLILSCVVGLLMTVALKRNQIPFGPSIAVATVICMLVGNYVTDWYLSLF